jgi:hypothetical protein
MSKQKIEAPNWGGSSTAKKPVNQYAPYSGPLDDNTVLNIGKEHQGKRLIDVPARWFLWYLEDSTGVKNKWLLEYINENLDALRAQAKQEAVNYGR